MEAPLTPLVGAAPSWLVASPSLLRMQLRERVNTATQRSNLTSNGVLEGPPFGAAQPHVCGAWAVLVTTR